MNDVIESKYEIDALPAPDNYGDMADQLRWLAWHMSNVATNMEAIGAGVVPFPQHVKELSGAAEMCINWAEEIGAIDDGARDPSSQGG